MPSFASPEILQRALPRGSGLRKQVAYRFGVSTSHVRAWCNGSKCNPVDQTVRLIGVLHKDQPGEARLIASHITEVVDELDAAMGASEAAHDEGIYLSLSRKVKESAEVAQVMIESAPDGYNEAEIKAALAEIADDRASLDALEGCLRARLNQLRQAEMAATCKAAPSGRDAADASADSFPVRSHSDQQGTRLVAAGNRGGHR